MKNMEFHVNYLEFQIKNQEYQENSKVFCNFNLEFQIIYMEFHVLNEKIKNFYLKV